MRISGGLAKGRKIKLVHGPEPLRPTPAKVREALFDILRKKIEGATFVDLYAGTGAIGIEAMSRGALKAIFVEDNRFRVEEIRRLVRSAGFTEKSMIIAKKARLFLADAFRKNEKFDIIFLDPPYHTEEIEHVLSDLGEMDLLKSGGVVVAEHFVKRKLPTISGRLQLIKDYTYGDTVLSVYSVSEVSDD